MFRHTCKQIGPAQLHCIGTVLKNKHHYSGTYRFECWKGATWTICKWTFIFDNISYDLFEISTVIFVNAWLSFTDVKIVFSRFSNLLVPLSPVFDPTFSFTFFTLVVIDIWGWKIKVVYNTSESITLLYLTILKLLISLLYTFLKHQLYHILPTSDTSPFLLNRTRRYVTIF